MNQTPSPADPFYGSFLKVERADKHIQEFDREVREFVALGPYRVVAHAHPNNPAALVWIAKVTHEVPSHFPLIIGDAIHNLRSALDIAICDIVRLNGLSVQRSDRFPTASSAQAFEDAIQKGLEQRIGPRVAQVLRTLEQPYPGGNAKSLRLLDQLDIVDKHRLLTPVAHNIAMHTFNRKGVKKSSIGLANSVYRPYKDGTPFFDTPRDFPGSTREHFEVGDELEATFEISFDKGGPFEYREVLPVLAMLKSDVAGALQTLRAAAI